VLITARLSCTITSRLVPSKTNDIYVSIGSAFYYVTKRTTEFGLDLRQDRLLDCIWHSELLLSEVFG
jgi:hypothetical protein